MKSQGWGHRIRQGFATRVNLALHWRHGHVWGHVCLLLLEWVGLEMLLASSGWRQECCPDILGTAPHNEKSEHPKC